MLAGLLLASLWATAATGALWSLGVALPVQAAPLGAPGALLGGVLFGLGAALNQGCSLSTLTRLAEGQWSMLLTLAGLGLGARGAHELVAQATAVHAGWHESASAWPGWPLMGGWVLLPVVIGLTWDALRAGRSRKDHSERRAGGTSAPWPPRHAAWLFGLGGALLYGGFGAWTYTNLLRVEATGQPVPALGAQLMLVASLLAGMAWSARHGGRWMPRGPDGMRPWGSLSRHLLGGVCMGMGSVAIPGGNDSVLLAWLPGLSLGGLAAYVGIVLGIAVPLWLRRRRARA